MPRGLTSFLFNMAYHETVWAAPWLMGKKALQRRFVSAPGCESVLSKTVKEKDLGVTMNANMTVSEQCVELRG